MSEEKKEIGTIEQAVADIRAGKRVFVARGKNFPARGQLENNAGAVVYGRRTIYSLIPYDDFNFVLFFRKKAV